MQNLYLIHKSSEKKKKSDDDDDDDNVAKVRIKKLDVCFVSECDLLSYDFKFVEITSTEIMLQKVSC